MYKKGFKSQNTEIDIKELPIIGNIPAWLNGTLFRNGPGKFEYPNKKLIHWFDGPIGYVMSQYAMPFFGKLIF